MTKYEPVDAGPVKRFFVEMLTRDISIEEAILDLLDNCVDGINRNDKNLKKSKRPYKDYWAKISIGKKSFEISDNCGGIPWSEHDRAFRMGRPNSTNETKGQTYQSVGVYGIGMKRAIFKMGMNALIWTQNGSHNYEIPISPEWIQNENDWNLSVAKGKDTMSEDGTLIMIDQLQSDVSDLFSSEKFVEDLVKKIQQHYALIIQKGFSVEVNGIKAEPNPIQFRFATTKNDDKSEVRPYMFKGEFDGVQVFLAVGLREPIPDEERISKEQEDVQYSSEYAGWTVICNDRVVLYCNRDELTGWGTAGVPRYHNQFIAISGVVEFRGDPKKLPTTTTKRGLNLSLTLYQQVLERMREGTRLFVDFTNQWKTKEAEAKNKVSPIPPVSFDELKEKQVDLEFHSVKFGLDGDAKQYKPKLPLPPSDSKDVRISYIREKTEVHRLAEVMLSDIEDMKEKDIPRLVGVQSFDFAYKELVAKKKGTNK